MIRPKKTASIQPRLSFPNFLGKGWFQSAVAPVVVGVPPRNETSRSVMEVSDDVLPKKLQGSPRVSKADFEFICFIGCGSATRTSQREDCYTVEISRGLASWTG